MKTEILGERIILRRCEVAFTEEIFAAAIESKGGEFTRWMPWCHENYKIKETKTFLENCESNWEKKEEFNFAVFEKVSGEFVGLTSLNAFNSIHNFYNLGYWIRVSQQKNGFASESARLLAQIAFNEQEINRIEILVAVENLPSQKTAEKAGATREGILRNRLKIGKRIHDAVIYSFIKKDFETL